MPPLDRKVQVVLGFWILVSPWLLGFSGASPMKWSNVILGTTILLVNLWAIFGVEVKKGEDLN